MASANQQQQDIQPGSQVRCVIQCVLIRGEYLGDNENGRAKVKTKKRGIVLVEKSILRIDEKAQPL